MGIGPCTFSIVIEYKRGFAGDEAPSRRRQGVWGGTNTQRLEILGIYTKIIHFRHVSSAEILPKKTSKLVHYCTSLYLNVAL